MQPISFLFVVLAVAQASLAKNILLRRQNTIDPSDIPSACQSTCTPALNVINTCTDDSCLCTNSFGSSYEACISCILGVGGAPTTAEEQQLQSLLDEITEECDSEGFSISSLTLGSFSTPSSGSASTSVGAIIPVASANTNPSVGFSSGSVVQGGSAPGPTPTGDGSGSSGKSGSGSGSAISGAVSGGAASYTWTAVVAGGVAALALGL